MDPSLDKLLVWESVPYDPPSRSHASWGHHAGPPSIHFPREPKQNPESSARFHLARAVGHQKYDAISVLATRYF
jgi:hypothetical protein